MRGGTIPRQYFKLRKSQCSPAHSGPCILMYSISIAYRTYVSILWGIVFGLYCILIFFLCNIARIQHKQGRCVKKELSTHLETRPKTLHGLNCTEKVGTGLEAFHLQQVNFIRRGAVYSHGNMLETK
ncbi:hypothetical protein BOTBODRAFT_585764 [Botryobasidium botryosum FD-172 SS1]|uniref:Copper transporter n=1 Tax=Botryobasidium botryosum (strain FD-172 SS1) TaxID=930990 RepID=A0A067M042_BOTB1|nr:hypothetical protein BOTBODRAFT_585764 [Botryobasidium botryosum FD-172 SS1]